MFPCMLKEKHQFPFPYFENFLKNNFYNPEHLGYHRKYIKIIVIKF